MPDYKNAKRAIELVSEMCFSKLRLEHNRSENRMILSIK